MQGILWCTRYGCDFTVGLPYKYKVSRQLAENVVFGPKSAQLHFPTGQQVAEHVRNFQQNIFPLATGELFFLVEIYVQVPFFIGLRPFRC